MIDFILAIFAHIILSLLVMPFMPFIAVAYTAYRGQTTSPHDIA